MQQEDDAMKQLHVAAFDYANQVATAIDGTHGDDFKTAFVAVLLLEVNRRQIPAPGGQLLKPKVKPGPKPGAKKKAKAAANVVGLRRGPGRPRKERPLEVPPEGSMTTAEAAAYLEITPKKLENLRTQGRGPKGHLINSRWAYTRETLDAFKAKAGAPVAQAA